MIVAVAVSVLGLAAVVILAARSRGAAKAAGERATDARGWEP